MSGLRPDVTAIFNFYNHIREAGQPPIVTTPQQFREAGWIVLGGGKTFHYNVPPYFDDVGESEPLASCHFNDMFASQPLEPPHLHHG